MADDLHQEAEGSKVELSSEHLDDRGVCDVEMALGRLPGDLPVDEPEELDLGLDAAEVLLNPFLVDDSAAVRELGVTGPCGHIGERAVDNARRAQGHALSVELAGDEAPAVVLAADHVGSRDPDVVEVGVVDVVRARQVHRDDPDPRGVHRDDEQRDSLVLGSVRIGAGGQPDVVGISGEARPDLRAVDHVLVPVPHCTGLECTQVGAGIGLGVADAEVDLAAEDLGEEEVLLLRAAELEDRRSHRVDRQHGHRGAGPHRLVEEDELLDRTAALAAVLGRPSDAEPAI